MNKNNKLIEILIEKFGCDEPIFLYEILSAWSEYSRPRVFQLLKTFVEQKALMKFDAGVYYIPTQTILGVSKLDPQKVIEKKYIKNNGKVFGYYTGLQMENAFGLTTQVPAVFEIVTEKEATRKRWVSVGKARVILHSGKTQITEKNAPIFQLLDVLKNADVESIKSQRKRFEMFMQYYKISGKDLFPYLKYYPNRVATNLNYLGEKNEITF